MSHAPRVLALTAAAFFMAACTTKDSSVAKEDSAEAHDSVAAIQAHDSAVAAMKHTNDSLAAAAGNAMSSGAASGSTSGMTGETRKTRGSAKSTSGSSSGGKIIGRDSFALPVGTMDENGRITKIKRDSN